MSDEAKKLPDRRTASGESPAVKTMRAKFESIADGETAATLADLDAALAEYLKKSESDLPPDTIPEPVPPVCEPNPILRCRCLLGTNGCMKRHEE